LDNVREFITPEDELIVIDGGSTDNTADIVNANSDIVTLFRSEPDIGEAHGFNKGILLSQGRYIKPLTDDDYFYPDAMRHAISVLDSHPEIDALLCGGEEFRVDPITLEAKLRRNACVPDHVRTAPESSELLSVFTCGVGLILARRVLSIAGLFDTAFRAIDTEYMYRLTQRDVDFRVLNTRLYRHFRHDQSAMLRHASDMRRDWHLISVRNGLPCSNPEAIASVFGLSDLPQGPALARLICNAERLRSGRLRCLIPLLDALLEGGKWTGRAARKRRSLLVPPSGAPVSSLSKDATWDEGLYAIRTQHEVGKHETK
jgi:glycosyltransferase involved in cell wall biosynthesis